MVEAKDIVPVPVSVPFQSIVVRSVPQQLDSCDVRIVPETWPELVASR